MEHHKSARRSRVDSSVVVGGPGSDATSASAPGGNVGSRPRSRMARMAMARSRARSDVSFIESPGLLKPIEHLIVGADQRQEPRRPGIHRDGAEPIVEERMRDRLASHAAPDPLAQIPRPPNPVSG